jgi:hypothetical protein
MSLGLLYRFHKKFATLTTLERYKFKLFEHLFGFSTHSDAQTLG